MAVTAPKPPTFPGFGPKKTADKKASPAVVTAEPKGGKGTASADKEGDGMLWYGAAALCVVALLVGIVVATQLGRDKPRAATAAAPHKVGTPAANIAIVAVVCSGCGKQLKVAEKLAGKKVKCPGCSKIVSVPAKVRQPLRQER